MSESLWGKQGETLSHKNASKEFGLTEDDVIEAIRNGILQYRKNYAHGNPYFRLLRSEVETLARKLHGSKAAEEQVLKHKLQAINERIKQHQKKAYLYYKNRNLNCLKFKN